jgi:EAL domain-containing protein (putative c-di-GMP-specific phosphodiesterase class I)
MSFIKVMASENGISPKNVVFEVTETASSQEMNLFVKAILQIKAEGYMVALDDFGTGYSSLSYMQKMQPDIVKIDMSFVRDIHQSDVNQRIVSAICQMAESTNAETVAEGVEVIEELNVLKDLEVSYVQGYFKGKPVAMDEFIEKFS